MKTNPTIVPIDPPNCSSKVRELVEAYNGLQQQYVAAVAVVTAREQECIATRDSERPLPMPHASDKRVQMVALRRVETINAARQIRRALVAEKADVAAWPAFVRDSDPQGTPCWEILRRQSYPDIVFPRSTTTILMPPKQ